MRPGDSKSPMLPWSVSILDVAIKLRLRSGVSESIRKEIASFRDRGKAQASPSHSPLITQPTACNATCYLEKRAGVDETSSSRDGGTISPSFRMSQLYVLLSLAEQPLIEQNILQLAACVLLVPSPEKGGAGFIVSL